MALTRDFKETIRARAARDSRFRRALLREGVACTLAGDAAIANILLRAYTPAAHLPRFLRRR